MPEDTALRTIDDLPAEWEVRRLAERLRAILPDLRARYALDSVALFGSYVRNEQRPESDLDLLVTCHGPLGLFEEVRLQDELAEALGVRVDIVKRKSLQPRLARYILREAREL